MEEHRDEKRVVRQEENLLSFGAGKSEGICSFPRSISFRLFEDSEEPEASASLSGEWERHGRLASRAGLRQDVPADLFAPPESVRQGAFSAGSAFSAGASAAVFPSFAAEEPLFPGEKPEKNPALFLDGVWLQDVSADRAVLSPENVPSSLSEERSAVSGFGVSPSSGTSVKAEVPAGKGAPPPRRDRVAAAGKPSAAGDEAQWDRFLCEVLPVSGLQQTSDEMAEAADAEDYWHPALDYTVRGVDIPAGFNWLHGLSAIVFSTNTLTREGLRIKAMMGVIMLVFFPAFLIALMLDGSELLVGALLFLPVALIAAAFFLSLAQGLRRLGVLKDGRRVKGRVLSCRREERRPGYIGSQDKEGDYARYWHRMVLQYTDYRGNVHKKVFYYPAGDEYYMSPGSCGYVYYNPEVPEQSLWVGSSWKRFCLGLELKPEKKPS